MGDNGELKSQPEKLSTIEEFKGFLRIRLADNLSLAEEIMHQLDDFVPLEEIIIGAKDIDGKVGVFINPGFNTPKINHAFCELDDAVRAERYARKLKAAQEAGKISLATKQDQHNIMKFARNGFRKKR